MFVGLQVVTMSLEPIGVDCFCSSGKKQTKKNKKTLQKQENYPAHHGPFSKTPPGNIVFILWVSI